ncbi:MAG: hypothetical protein MUC69_08485 [Gemmatimonadales bacterium]|nr:hypothetical protein [Gemmatimonadales bacterium]
MTILALLLLAAALGSAVMASIQQSREIRRLSDDLEALARPRLVEPAAGPPHADKQMFGALYEERTSPFDGLNRLKGVPLVLSAAMLGLVGSALALTSASSAAPAKPAEVAEAPAPPPVDSLALLTASRDSLARLVAQLQDSVTLARSAPAAAPRRAPSSRGARTSGPARASAASDAVLPPAPKIALP